MLVRQKMTLKERMCREEAELKVIMEQLSALSRDQDPASQRERERALHGLTTRLVETRCAVDEWLSGHTERDRNALAYKIRVEYPLFSLLDSLACLSGEFVDWSVRDLSLTLAAAQ
jgi:hypothetical protein